MNKLMCHVVAGYPTPTHCLELMRGMQAANVAAIEVQIPFSDPIADGETIMRANDVAIERGMTTAHSFDLITQARSQGVTIDIYLMSYLQKVHHFGLEQFCEWAATCRIKGLIIPDLPHDSPDFVALHKVAVKHALQLIPVLSPGMSADRLTLILQSKPEEVYVTTQRGITGNAFASTMHLQQFVSKLKQRTDATIMLGFGIASAKDVQDALKLGDIAVMGSAIITQLQKTNVAQTLDYIGGLVN